MNNQLQLTAANGFLLNLMSGGQLLVNLANSIVFEYSNKGVQVVSPNLTVSFVQPLLRGAWARIVTQGLSLQERNVLYNLRAFAEFRRQFYVSLVPAPAVLAHSARRRAIWPCSTSFRTFATSRKTSSRPGRISPSRGGVPAIEKRARCVAGRKPVPGLQASLLSAQAGLQTSLDAFKINLGLPTEVEVRIDDSPLDQFELNDERLDAHAHPNRGAVAAARAK